MVHQRNRWMLSGQSWIHRFLWWTMIQADLGSLIQIRLKYLFSKFRKYFVFFSSSLYQRDLDLIIVPLISSLQISSFWRISTPNSFNMFVFSRFLKRYFRPVSFEEPKYCPSDLFPVISFCFLFLCMMKRLWEERRLRFSQDVNHVNSKCRSDEPNNS